MLIIFSVFVLWLFSLLLVMFITKSVVQKKIGVKIHNELANDLAIMSMRLEQFKGELNIDEKLDYFMQDFKKLSVQTRAWSHNLYNNVSTIPIDHFIEVKKTINNLIKPQDNLDVILNYDWNENDLSIFTGKQRAINLVLLKESIINSIKHSKSSKIFIDFWSEDHYLVMRIEDGGVGFILDSSKRKSIGLEMMQKQVDKIKAVMQIDTNIGQGTSLTFKFPLEK
jgi:signal transduction histidine kinase